MNVSVLWLMYNTFDRCCYEVVYAVSIGKNVLCVYNEDANVSAMVRGNKQ